VPPHQDKLDKANIAQKGMAAKLQAALDAEGEARRREAKVCLCWSQS
jgi:hypothetical protein